MATEPEERPVHVCPGCSGLVSDPTHHATVCPALLEAKLGPQIVEWLDSIDLEELDADSLKAGFDSTATEAIMAELRKRAEAL